MTNREAIEQLQSRVDLITDKFHEDKVLTAFKEALKMGIAALKQQEPVKPEKQHTNSGIRYGKCARCGAIVNHLQNGCPGCVGALDWSDTNETCEYK